ncbi:hypothetical protein E2C01_070563 [Portunus trituberculatus]|uniref:Fibronectin type-III domain-containing protein n=1 Tax=Portunus trituberculatus TaxID=210409 RepID=A0A5B7I5L2_PORTR|nr:hypothetical protein [Portunus trituberculatus]
MVNDSSHITLTWTAPGDDLDSGIGKEPGEQIVFTAKLKESLAPDTLYFVSLRAVDHKRNNGLMSRPVGFISDTARERIGISKPIRVDHEGSDG